MKGTKKFLALLLALILCFSLLPVSAFANDEPANGEQANAPAGEQTNAPAEEQTNAPAEEQTNAPAEEQTNAPAEEQTNDPADLPADVPADAPTDTPTDPPADPPAHEHSYTAGYTYFRSPDDPEAAGYANNSAEDPLFWDTESCHGRVSKCSCGATDKTGDILVEAHSFDENGVCTLCGYAKTYTVTVTYTVPEGYDAPASQSRTGAVGMAYSIDSPDVEGLSPDRATVSGEIGGADEAVAVTYAAAEPTRSETACGEPAGGEPARGVLTVENGGSVNLSSSDTDTLDLSNKPIGFTVHVYDNGGADGNYSNYCDGTLLITAPTNCVLRFSGSGVTEGGYDYFYLYDGDTDTASVQKDGSFSIDQAFTSGNVLKIRLTSDSSGTRTGFSLTVTVADLSAMITLSFAAGEGSGTMGSLTLVPGDEVTVPACGFTPPENQLFSHYTDGTNTYYPGDVITLNASKTLTAVYSNRITVTYAFGENTQTADIAQGGQLALPTFTSLFTLPERKIFRYWLSGAAHYDEGELFVANESTTFTAVLEDEPVIRHGEAGTAYSSCANYALLPKTLHVTADLSGESAGYLLWVFDDGGVNNNYSDGCDGSITVIAPEGLRICITSDVTTYDSDYLRVYDGATTEAALLGGPYSGTTTFGTATNTALFSSGNTVTVSFHSDGWSNKRGIDMKVRVYDPATSLVTVSFDPGEGSGTMDDLVLLAGDQTYLPSCGFTLPEKTFFYRYTDGTREYSANDLVTVNSDLHLTAVYIEKILFTYRNGLTEVVKEYRKGARPALENYQYYSYMFSSLPYRKSFRAWSINGVEYAPGDYYTANEDTIITALFTDLPILQDDGSGGFFVVMPEVENVQIDLTGQPNGFTFALYDNGGSNSNYTNNCDGSLTFTAPAGYVFAVSGSGHTENYQNTNNDRLCLYDSDLTAYLGENNPYSGTFAISELTTTSNRVKVFFHTDGSGVYEGLDLTVMMYDPSTRRTVTFAAGEGGSGTMDDVSVFSDSAYTLPVCGFTNPSGRVFAGWTDGTDTYQAGTQHIFTENTTLTALWAESTGVTYAYDGATSAFEVPKNVPLTLPAFTDLFTLPSRTVFAGWQEHISGVVYQPGDSYLISNATVFNALVEPLPVVVSDGEGGWYAEMPASGSLTADVSGRPSGFSFTIYDDGGSDGNYSDSCSGTLIIKAPEGFLIRVSGSMNTESGYDKLYLYDDSSRNDSKRLVNGFSGSQSLGEITTTDHYLTIYFYSDSSVNKPGFELTVTLEAQAGITYVYGDESKFVGFRAGDSVELKEFEDLFDLPDGYAFVCWSSGDDEYAEDQEITPADSMTLTAVLELMPTVTLDGSGALLLAAYGGDGTATVSPPFPVPKNEPILLPNASEFFEVPDGKVFGGWRHEGVTYGVGVELSTDTDVTLTAVWVDLSPWDELAATLSAAAPGTDLGTIVLTGDLIGGTGSDMLSLPAGVTATIDLNGHTINGTATALAQAGVMLEASGALTIVDTAGGGAVTGGAVRVFGNDGLNAPAAILAGFAAGVEVDYRSGDDWSRYVAIYYPTAEEALRWACGIGETYEGELPAHDSSETYVFLLADVTVPAGESWSVYTGYGWINLDLNGHTLDVRGALSGSGRIYLDSTVPGVFRSSGTIDLDLTPFSDDACYFTGGTVNRSINAFGGSVTISGGVFNDKISLPNTDASVASLTISGGTFNDEISLNSGSVTISGGTFEEEVSVYGGTVDISGGTFVHWVNFDNFYGSPVLSLSGEANLGGLYFEIYTNEESSDARLTVSDSARIAELGYDLNGSGTGTKPTVTLAGGYYGKEGAHAYKNPETWPDVLGGALEFVFLAPVETYSGQPDWAYDGTDYPWRIVRPSVTLSATTDCSGSSVGDITVSPGGTLYAGDAVTLTAPIVPGYTFNGWSNGHASRVYSFTITQNTALTANYTANGSVSVTVNGGESSYTINGSAKSGSFTASYPLGSKLSLAVTRGDFAYWANSYGKVLSRSKSYTFTVTGEQSVTAVFNTTAEDKATLVFESDYGQIMARDPLAAGETMTIPSVPTKNGYDPVGWDFSGDGVYNENDTLAGAISAGLAAEGRIWTIRPLYTLRDTMYTVTVVNGDGGGSYRQNTVVTVTANDAPAGQKFSHWTDGTVICSYSTSYSFYAEKNVTLTAIFVEDSAAVEAVGTTAVINLYADPANRKLTFVSMSTVPEGCRIQMAGILATDDAAVANGTFDETTAKFVRGDAWSGNAYRYTFTKGKVEPGVIWYARAYLVYTDTNGNQRTVYGSVVQNAFPA